MGQLDSQKMTNKEGIPLELTEVNLVKETLGAQSVTVDLVFKEGLAIIPTPTDTLEIVRCTPIDSNLFRDQNGILYIKCDQKPYPKSITFTYNPFQQLTLEKSKYSRH